MFVARSRIALVAAVCGLASCGGEPAPGTASGGTLLIATGGDVDAVLPPLVQTLQGKQVMDALFLPIAFPADELTIVGDAGYTPALADRWEWSADSLSIAFHLDPRARWQDGTPVTAADVRYSFAAFRAPAIGAMAAPNLANIDSVAVRDPRTFVAWFKQRSPTQFFDLAYNFFPFPEHVYGAVPLGSLATSAAARVPVGSGKFRLARWVPGERLELVADTAHWLGRARLDRVAWLTVSDPTAQASKLVTGEVDMVEVLRGPALQTAAADSSIRLVVSPSYSHALAVFNLRDPANPTRPHPIFAEVGVRRALTLAVNRRVLVSSILDSLGVVMTSPYVTSLAVAGAALLPFDSAGAVALLDSIGWRDTNGDGVRDKAGRPLAFNIASPPGGSLRGRAAEIMQQAFSNIGARVTLDQVENGVLLSNTSAGKFDLSIMGYSGDPSPAAIRQDWRTQDSPEGSNYGRYSNPAFDATIDSATSRFDVTGARALFGRAGAIIASDAPAIWLYEIKTVAGIHRRFRTAPMPTWAWWAHLDQWSVDPQHMKDRDRIGAGAPK